MPKYKFTIISEYITEAVIEASDEVEASEQMDALLEDGYIGDRAKGFWDTREYGEPEELCNFCNEPIKNSFGLPCCKERIKEV